MVKQVKLTADGLCFTCTHAPGCALRNDRATPIFACEEFSSNGATARGRRRATAPVQARRGAPASPATGVGLCATCEARKSCALSESEGGVWHCEEYR